MTPNAFNLGMGQQAQRPDLTANLRTNMTNPHHVSLFYLLIINLRNILQITYYPYNLFTYVIILAIRLHKGQKYSLFQDLATDVRY